MWANTAVPTTCQEASCTKNRHASCPGLSSLRHRIAWPATVSPSTHVGLQQLLGALPSPAPLVRQELVLSRSILDLDAACTQRASLGIVLDIDTAERGAIDATRHLVVRIRSSRWRLQRSRISRTPGDTSRFFGQKDAIGVCNIICKRWTMFKPKTSIQGTRRQKKIHGTGFETHPRVAPLLGFIQQMLE